jgi:hypothetical protein
MVKLRHDEPAAWRRGIVAAFGSMRLEKRHEPEDNQARPRGKTKVAAEALHTS